MSDKRSDKKRVCPWWLCFTFDNPFRKLLHNPKTMLSPYVQPGSSAIDVGAGMGYFAIPMAGLVGPTGRVTAIDIQGKMLSTLSARARRRGLSERIFTYLAGPDSLGRHPQADFILAFWMVHEVPDQPAFLREISGLLKPEGLFLLVEPKAHVPEKNFLETMRTAGEIGLAVKERPNVRLSHSALFGRK
jgi:ubiquinone/menaquinone biosynthesis C-methylase UbiE